MGTDTKDMFVCPHCGNEHPKSVETCPAGGEAISSHHKLVGNILEGKYALIKVIGEGGMGIVYQAKHMLIGRKLAVKILFPEIAIHPEIVERFYNEARTAASIGHDHIIEITDMGTFEKSPFIVMEFLEGMSLARFMGERIVPLEDGVGILMQVLDALNAVHTKGVIHRDLKPDNIFLIEKSGRADFVKLLDFGISKLKTPEAQNLALTRTGTVLGTPYYMAPEQAAGKKEQDHRIDIYAVGVILYEMMTGLLPYQGDNYNALIAAILTEEPARPSAYNPSMPQELENIIMTAISKQPHMRYPNAVNFMEALKPFAPSWSLRPSKTSGLSSTVSYGQTVAAPTPTPLADSHVSVSQTPAPIGVSDTGKLSLTGAPVETGGRGKTFVIVGVLAVVLMVIVASLAVAFGPRLFGGRGESPENEGAAVTTQPPEKKVEEAGPPEFLNREGKGAVDDRVNLEFTGIPEGAVVMLGEEKLEGNPARIEPSDEKRQVMIEAEGYETWIVEKIVNSNMVIDVIMKEVEDEGISSKRKKKNKKEVETGTSKPVFIVEKEEPTEKETKTKKKKGGKKPGSEGYGGKETGIDDSIY